MTHFDAALAGVLSQPRLRSLLNLTAPHVVLVTDGETLWWNYSDQR